MLEKLHITITILAATLVTAFGLYLKVDTMRISLSLIFVIIAFYIIGLIVKAYLMSRVFVVDSAVIEVSEPASEDSSGDIQENESYAEEATEDLV